MARLHGLQPEQLARIGMFYFEEAVLDALYEARRNEEEEEQWLEPKQISERLDIPRSSHYHHYAAVHGILGGLAVEKRVEYNDEARKIWRLTTKEFEGRRDD